MKKNYGRLIVMGVILTLLVGTAVLFTSCSGPANLEEALKSDKEAQEMISRLEGSGIEITAEENTLIYTYRYDEAYDFSDPEIRAAVSAELENAVGSMESAFTTVSDQLESELDIDEVKVRVEYLDSDGEELYAKDF